MNYSGFATCRECGHWKRCTWENHRFSSVSHEVEEDGETKTYIRQLGICEDCKLEAQRERERAEFEAAHRIGHCSHCKRKCWLKLDESDEVALCRWCKESRVECDQCLDFYIASAETSKLDGCCSQRCFDERQVGRWLSDAEDWWYEWDYNDTVIERLPNKLASEKVLSATVGPKGLVLFGASGRAKTRTAGLLIRKLMEQGKKVAITSGIEFQREVVKRTKPGGSSDLDEWLRKFEKSDVVFLDDIDKCRFTPRVQSELFGLVDCLTRKKKAMIITTNCLGRELAAKLAAGDQDSDPFPIVRRIGEFCEPIDFDSFTL